MEGAPVRPIRAPFEKASRALVKTRRCRTFNHRIRPGWEMTRGGNQEKKKGITQDVFFSSLLFRSQPQHSEMRDSLPCQRDHSPRPMEFVSQPFCVCACVRARVTIISKTHSLTTIFRACAGHCLLIFAETLAIIYSTRNHTFSFLWANSPTRVYVFFLCRPPLHLILFVGGVYKNTHAHAH